LLTVIKKNNVTGAKPQRRRAITETAVSKNAKCWLILSFEPKSTLKMYRVGRQTSSVTRYRAGSLIVEDKI